MYVRTGIPAGSYLSPNSGDWFVKPVSIIIIIISFPEKNRKYQRQG